MLALNNLNPSTTSIPVPTTSLVSTAPSIATATTTETKAPIDINSLLNNLLKVGLIKDSNSTASSAPSSVPQGNTVKLETPQTEGKSAKNMETSPSKVIFV